MSETAGLASCLSKTSLGSLGMSCLIAETSGNGNEAGIATRRIQEAKIGLCFEFSKEAFQTPCSFGKAIRRSPYAIRRLSTCKGFWYLPYANMLDIPGWIF